MASTYSTNLRIQLITTGEQAGVWGASTNTNLGSVIEQAITGYETISITSANQALTYADGAPDQARNAILNLTTTTAAAFNVYAPPVDKTYIIRNSSSYTATIYCSSSFGNTTPGGAGVAIPAGKTAMVWTNITNVQDQINHISGALSVTGGVTAALTGNVTGNLTGNVSAGAGTIQTTNYTITEVGGVLYFKNGATNIAKLDSSGNLTVLGNVTAYGTI